MLRRVLETVRLINTETYVGICVELPAVPRKRRLFEIWLNRVVGLFSR